MAADIFTKHFTSKESWEHAIRLLGFRHGDFSKILDAHPPAVITPTSRTVSPAPNPPLCSFVPHSDAYSQRFRDVRIPPHDIQLQFP